MSDVGRRPFDVLPGGAARNAGAPAQTLTGSMLSPAFHTGTSSSRTAVPCQGCTACCRGDLIVLHPEHGDRIEDYDTYQEFNPVTGRMCHALKRDEKTNACVYLGATGCTIHERAPVICREFDCRRMYLKFTRAERRRLIAQGGLDRKVMAAGRARLATLKEPTK